MFKNNLFCFFKKSFPKKYSAEAMWLTVKKNIGLVGITEEAISSIGDINFIELPKIGKVLERKGFSGSLESNKGSVDIFSPVSGFVVEINKKIISIPSLLNKDPLNNWMWKMKLSNIKEYDDLLSEEEYHKKLNTVDKN